MEAVHTMEHPVPGVTTLAQVARLIMDSSPTSLCCPCIASTLARRLSSVRQAAARLEGSETFMRRHDRCGACQQARLVLGVAGEPGA
jgi:hypothetical protein